MRHGLGSDYSIQFRGQLAQVHLLCHHEDRETHSIEKPEKQVDSASKALRRCDTSKLVDEPI